jgi:hypothetical protein
MLNDDRCAALQDEEAMRYLYPDGLDAPSRSWESISLAGQEISQFFKGRGVVLNTKKEDRYAAPGGGTLHKKYVLTCDRGGKHRPRGQETALFAEGVAGVKSRATSTKKTDCKFAININAQKRDNGESSLQRSCVM